MRIILTSLPPNFTFEDLSKLISKSLYPNYFKFMKLALTFPIGSVKCKRSISALVRIHTLNHTNMNYDGFTNLCLLAIEPDFMSTIPTAQIVSKFAETKSRQLLLSVAARELFIGGLKIIISITTNNFYLDFYNS